jgi:trigger factor
MALIEGCKHSLAFAIPVDDVEAEMARVVADFSRKVRLPGFRPGKAPVSLIRTKFEGDIRQQVLENLVPRALNQRFRDENLNVVGQPSVKDLKFEKGQPIEFQAEFEVAPDFELGEYTGIEAPYKEATVSEEEIVKRIDQVRDSKADFVNLDPRPSEDGDFAVFSLESVAGVEPPMSSDEMTIEIGGQETMPEFSANLRGASPGDEREFDVVYPEDYGQERLAGKTVRFKVVLKQLRRKELPEPDDHFAQDIGFQTFEEVREAVRTALMQEKEQAAVEMAKTAIVEKLIDAHQFPVPEAFVDRQIEVNTENYLRTLAAQGVDIRKDVRLDWNKVKESQQERATREVRGSLILGKIADREGIVPTQDDVDKEIQRISRATKDAPAVVRLKLEKDGRLDQIASQIRTAKTIQFLFDKSRKIAG